MLKHAPPAGAKDDGVEIDPELLCPGLFIRLNLSWVQHNFLFNQFRISTHAQVHQLQALGLKTITYYPSRSTCSPLTDATRATASRAADNAPRDAGSRGVQQTASAAPPEPAQDSTAQAAASAPPTPTDTGAQAQSRPAQPEPSAPKQEQARKLAAQRAAIARCERRYVAAAAEVKNVMHDIFPAGPRAVQSARKLVDGIAEGLTGSGEIVLHLMNEKLADESAYFHVLNVMVLSMLLGRELKLPREVLQLLGESALLHDIGKLKVPDTVLRNDHRNRHEEEFFRLHTRYGRELAQEIGGLAPAVCDVIELHHETMDGKGYPRGLRDQQVPLLARVVGIANRYDNLCNPMAMDKALTPAEALTRMFRDEGKAWDKTLLQAFIRLMGVYPPGSLVQLSNGNVALVVAVNHANLLRPAVMVFDPEIPKEDALVVDLIEEPEVQIDLVLAPRDLEPAALNYLSPRRRMSYYHDQRNA